MQRSSYPPDVINKAKALYLRGNSVVQIAKKLEIGSKNTVLKWVRDGDWDELLEELANRSNKSIQGEFESEISAYKRSKVKFFMKMYGDLVRNYNSGNYTHESLRCSKMMTEIIANIDSGLSAVVSLDDLETINTAKDFVEKVRGNDEIEKLYDDELSEADGNRKRKAV